MSLIQKFGWFALAVLLFAGIASCKEEEEETVTSASMTGSVVMDVPYYVLKGETVTMEASGIEYPDDAYYKWHVSGVYVDSLDTNPITIHFPDSLASFTVSAVAYCPGYYISVNTRQVTTIDTTWNTSFTGLHKSREVFCDERDGRAYRYVTIGGLDWFTQNLAYGGIRYRASQATAPYFGNLYSWEMAMEEDVCPEGWRVPTNEDWESLAAALNGGVPLPFVGRWPGLGAKVSADVYLNGTRMWPYSPDNLHTNDCGWNAMPLGYCFVGDHDIVGLNEYGCWWSATEKDATHAYYRYVWYDDPDFPMSYTGKSDLMASIRCVRTRPQSW